MPSIRAAYSAGKAGHLAKGLAQGKGREGRQAVTLPLAMDRRDVLKLGGAAAIALLAPAGAASVAALRSGTAASTIVLADPRYAESAIFAASLERHGAKVIAACLRPRQNLVSMPSSRFCRWPSLSRRAHLESDLFVLERSRRTAQARGHAMWACMIGGAGRARSIGYRRRSISTRSRRLSSMAKSVGRKVWERRSA